MKPNPPLFDYTLRVDPGMAQDAEIVVDHENETIVVPPSKQHSTKSLLASVQTWGWNSIKWSNKALRHLAEGTPAPKRWRKRHPKRGRKNDAREVPHQDRPQY